MTLSPGCKSRACKAGASPCDMPLLFAVDVQMPVTAFLAERPIRGLHPHDDRVAIEHGITRGRDDFYRRAVGVEARPVIVFIRWHGRAAHIHHMIGCRCGIGLRATRYTKGR